MISADIISFLFTHCNCFSSAPACLHRQKKAGLFPTHPASKQTRLVSQPRRRAFILPLLLYMALSARRKMSSAVLSFVSSYRA